MSPLRLTQSRTHAQDCEDCETTEGFVHTIECAITLVGDLTDGAARPRLLEIADKCPVHKTLSGEIKIRSALASAPA